MSSFEGPFGPGLPRRCGENRRRYLRSFIARGCHLSDPVRVHAGWFRLGALIDTGGGRGQNIIALLTCILDNLAAHRLVQPFDLGFATAYERRDLRLVEQRFRRNDLARIIHGLV